MNAPRATYRLQFHAGFGFRDALRAVPYLHDLGVSHLYASPLLRSVTGSTHGYDTTDPTALNPELGTRPDFDGLVAALRSRGMGLLLDIVPNHMAAHHENPWWWDVLLRGARSRYARWFDIDWSSGRVVLPILGESPRDAVASGALRLEPRAATDGPSATERVLRYHGVLLPLSSGTTESGDMDRVLRAQHYELAQWREGLARINYRRFFDVTGLVGFRADEPEPFAASHALVLDLAEQGAVDGLRVDHVDGIADPDRYLAMLRAALADRGRPDLYVVVEKVLSPGERLRKSWPVQGTTGYDFLNAVSRLFVDPGGFAAMHRRATDRFELPAWPEAATRARAEVLRALFPAETAALVALLSHAAPGVPRSELESALIDGTAALTVYRTYDAESARRWFEPPVAGVSPRARDALRAAASDPEFVRRWSQLSGPAAAKGVEDTALYRHVVLASLNEVGGEPVLRGDAVAEFHAQCVAAAAGHPGTMLSTSTHDTKRGEDVRSRIHAISTLAPEWEAATARWSAANAALRGPVSPRAEELLYQTILGVWPRGGTPSETLVRRVQDYAVKAAREAKLETCWLAPDGRYEAALRDFAAALLDGRSPAFLAEMGPLAERAAAVGAASGLSRTVLKCFAPGVPDTYQGCEFWDDSLVDPDNRRPVDFASRAAALAGLRARDAGDRAALLDDLCANWNDGRVKLWLLAACLAGRREHADLVARGSYAPLHARGPRAADVVAFARDLENQSLLVAVARWPASPASPGGAAWGGTALRPPADHAEWTDTLTGERFAGVSELDAGVLFRRLPARVLVRSGPAARSSR